MVSLPACMLTAWICLTASACAVSAFLTRCNLDPACFAGEPFPSDPKKVQVCCPAGTEGYYDKDNQPACCADGEWPGSVSTRCV